MTLLTSGGGRRRLAAMSDPTTSWPATDPLAAFDVQAAPYNVDRQTVPTPDGSGQVVHPSVVDFRTAWNGYRYWLAVTPYKGSNVALENPVILASHDGVEWSPPPGISNPIYPWQGSPGYNSDPELVFDPSTGRLICYWREVVSETLEVSRTLAKFSTDGVTWSDVVQIMTDQHFLHCLSPSVVRRRAGDWWMFAVSVSGEIGMRVYRSVDPLAGWGASQVTPIPELFHADVIWDGAAFRLLSVNGNGAAISVRSSRTGYEWSAATAVMWPRPGYWDAALYRPTITVRDDTWMRVWYSARSGTGGHTEWYMAGTQMPRSLWPAPPA